MVRKSARFSLSCTFQWKERLLRLCPAKNVNDYICSLISKDLDRIEAEKSVEEIHRGWLNAKVLPIFKGLVKNKDAADLGEIIYFPEKEEYLTKKLKESGVVISQQDLYYIIHMEIEDRKRGEQHG